MEIIAFILMILFALISASDKKRKAARNAGQPREGTAAGATQRPVSRMSLSERQARLEALRQKKAERAARADAPVMPSNAEEVFESSLTELKQLLSVTGQAAPGEGESLLEDPDCRGGSMPHDHAEGQSVLKDEECAGGSMPHRHTQGEERSAQRSRLSELDRRREAEEDTPRGLLPTAVDAQSLRRAVVMAEVLGKPKALKQSRFVA